MEFGNRRFDMSKPDKSRREFVKKAAYVPPAVLTLAATPAFAKNGSDKKDKEPKDPKPPKLK
jgi:hypothetical protein